MKTVLITLPFLGLLLALSCGNGKTEKEEKTRELSDQFKQYWFEQGAEITTFKLDQVRYGEHRSGDAVHVFVTEPFDPQKLVKPDNYSKGQVQVLKLNAIRKFVTGVYDYSMMTSTFFPILNGNHSLKITASSQEWCGHTFTQLENRKQFEITGHSYFESEGETHLKLPKTWLEDDLFTLLRINPNLLPVGKCQAIPSFTFLRLKHEELKAQEAEGNLKSLNDSVQIYSFEFPKLERKLTIFFGKDFPHVIHSWSETYPESWTGTDNIMTTKATRNKSIRLRYWENHNNADSTWRHLLQLPE